MGRQVVLRSSSSLLYRLAEHVVSAYLLAAAALGPFYGKFSDLAGRKAVLYPVIIIFLVSQCLIHLRE